jgi:hypothetical protein
MTRCTLATLASLWAVPVLADVAPPDSHVRVRLDHVIETDREFPEYVFVVMVGNSAEWSYKADLGKDRPLRIVGEGRGGRARMCWLTAVPVETAKAYKTDKELVTAVVEYKAEGVLTSKGRSFDSFAVVPKKDAPKVIEAKHRIERITPEEGIVLASENAVPAADPDPHGLQEESAVRWAIAGVVAALAVCGLGLWLLGRRRGPGA